MGSAFMISLLDHAYAILSKNLHSEVYQLGVLRKYYIDPIG